MTFFTLFSCVSVKNIVHLFSNALLERRIILVAENLSTLSSCVMAASNLLQPFHWQHVYIPVLPLVLMDYCFSEKVSLLTDRGWASLAAVERRWQTVGEKSALRVAAWDAERQQTVFQAPSRLIVNAAQPQQMIRFGGVLVTPEHRMWVFSENRWRKARADALVDRWAVMAVACRRGEEEEENWGEHFSPMVCGEGDGCGAVQVSPTDGGIRLVRARGRWEAGYAGRTWCVTVPSGLLWARGESGVFPPMICGNCTAPMPFFVGVLKSCLPLLERMPLEVGKRQMVGQFVLTAGAARRCWCSTLRTTSFCWTRASRRPCPSPSSRCRKPLASLSLSFCLLSFFLLSLLFSSLLFVLFSSFLLSSLFLSSSCLFFSSLLLVLLLTAPQRLLKTLSAAPLAPDRDSDLRIASIFYQFFHDIFAGYENYYELRDLPPAKGDAPGAPPRQGFRFDLAKFAASKPPNVRAFLERFSESQVLQTFLQESESEERRYRFVNQQEYISHLAVSRDLEMAEAVRNVGRALGNAWKVREQICCSI